MINKILLVDDDIDILRVLMRRFGRDFNIEVAQSGREALKLIKTNGPFTVIVSDMQMPEMHGLEFLSRARKNAAESVRIILSGEEDLKKLEKAMEEGIIHHFLRKPFKAEELFCVLAKGLEQYSSIRVAESLQTMFKSLMGQNIIPAEKANLATAPGKE